jgi:hypothetical protein
MCIFQLLFWVIRNKFQTQKYCRKGVSRPRPKSQPKPKTMAGAALVAIEIATATAIDFVTIEPKIPQRRLRKRSGRAKLHREISRKVVLLKKECFCKRKWMESTIQ